MDVTDLVFIDSTGYSYADYPTFLSWLQSGYQTIYGADVYLGADSQDGQFVALLAQALFDTAALGASVYNSFSPVTAQGVGLSRLVKINGLTREIPSNSTVELTIVGTAGTVISNGVAQDILNQLWDLPATVTIPGGGTITTTATAENPGSITADASTVTTIFTPTLGWQSVTNSSPATPGAPVESDATLRARQAVSTSLPAQTVFDATISGVENVAGVTDVRGYENYTGSTNGDGLPPHSISVVVTGGLDQDIGNVIMSYKTPGTNTYGNTAVDVVDAKGMPLTINFQRSVVATISAQVTISTNAAYSSAYAAQIQAAVAAQINSFLIGNNVLLNTLFAPAFLIGTPAYGSFTVTSILLEKNSGGFFASDVTILWDEQPVCAAADVDIIT